MRWEKILESISLYVVTLHLEWILEFKFYGQGNLVVSYMCLAQADKLIEVQFKIGLQL